MVSRRTFILSGAAVGGGMVFGYARWKLDDGDAAVGFARSGYPGIPLNAWLKISPSGIVTCGIHRAEMGQGVTTSLAMLLIEELDADWEKVRFEFPPVDRDYFNFGMLAKGQPFGDPKASMMAGAGTWAVRKVFHALGMSMTISSSSVIDAWDTLRPAGATARQMLLAAAAKTWQVDAATLTTEKGWVIDSANDQRLSYGDLADAASRERPVEEPALRSPLDYRYVGRNMPRLDTLQKITGAAEFGIDVIQPDMLYAAIAHSPIVGTQVLEFATNGADEMPGVEKIVLAGRPGQERAVAVIAANTWVAMQAAEKIAITPASIVGSPVNTETLFADYLAHLDSAEPVVFREDGNAAEVIDASTVSVTAEYAVPYLAHACMEPMNCTALYTGTTLELWIPTQANSISRDLAAEIAGLDTAQVKVHTTFLGGGFGRRAEMDFVEQAVSVAMQMPGRPIKLTWSREQDMRHDAYRCAAVSRLHGAASSDGKLLALNFQLVTQSVVASYEERTPTPRGGDAQTDATVLTSVDPTLYPIPNLRVSNTPITSHVPVGFWRSVSHSWTTFFLESFIDELAVAASLTPLELRQRTLSQKPRQLRVLNTVASQVELKSQGRVGYAMAESHGTVVAHAIEVVTRRGRFSRVKKVICAIDCGPVVHPDNVIAQMESSIVDGLSAALYGQVDIADGVVVQGNFDSYRRLKMAEVPVIEVHLINSAEGRPGGVGEPGVPGIAPALANAIFAATGERIRQLPIALHQWNGEPA